MSADDDAQRGDELTPRPDPPCGAQGRARRGAITVLLGKPVSITIVCLGCIFCYYQLAFLQQSSFQSRPGRRYAKDR